MLGHLSATSPACSFFIDVWRGDRHVACGTLVLRCDIACCRLQGPRPRRPRCQRQQLWTRAERGAARAAARASEAQQQQDLGVSGPVLDPLLKLLPA